MSHRYVCSLSRKKQLTGVPAVFRLFTHGEVDEDEAAGATGDQNLQTKNNKE